MTTGKVFMTGRSQAVRLPKEYRFDDDEVILNKIGDVLIVIPKNKAKEIFLSSLDQFSDDYMSDGVLLIYVHVGYQYLHICHFKKSS